MDIIYDCALRDFMLGEDHKVIDTVIPNLTAFRALLVMKDIDAIKSEERKKEAEKQEREGKKVQFVEEEEEKKPEETPQLNGKKKPDEKFNISSTSMLSDAQIEKERER